MTVDKLIPGPTGLERFSRSRERFVPECSGCYVLTTIQYEVLYVGLADNIRRRMGQHLDSPGKTALTKKGRAVLIHWLETADTRKVERTWLNIHVEHEGAYPILNSVYSPTYT